MIRQMILLALAAADYFRAAQFRGRRRLRRTSVAERYGLLSGQSLPTFRLARIFWFLKQFW
jgi:hypothetical protein